MDPESQLTSRRVLMSAFGLRRSTVSVIGVAWLAAALLAQVGIPPVDPRLEVVARPMETLGTVAVCVPVSLHAALLHDRLPWLHAVTPRAAWGLRLAWLGALVAGGAAPCGAWLAALPHDVPRTHAAGIVVLCAGLAAATVTGVRHDLAVLGPLLTIVVFSIGSLVPWNANVIYNVQRTGALWGVALATAVTAIAAYAVRGDRSAWGAGYD